MKFFASLIIAMTFINGLACNDKSGFSSGVANSSSNGDGKGINGNVDNANAGTAGGSNDAGSAGIKLGNVNDVSQITLKVDLVFAIDTSPTMDGEIAATVTNMGKLISALVGGQLDPNIHLLIDKPFALPAGADPKKVVFVIQKVNSNNSISRLNLLISGQFNTFYADAQGQLLPAPLAFRKDAKMEIVVISDDNGRGTGNLAADFDTTKTLKNYTFNSIVGLPNSAQGGNCQLASVGSEYLTLSQQTGGSSLDLYSPDWTNLITRLSSDMIKRSVTFALSKKPIKPADIQVLLDGQKLPSSSFSYDVAKNSVTLTKTDAVKHGSKVQLSYDAAQ